MHKIIILIGGGGHCRACIDVLEQQREYAIAGIIDLPELLNQKILGYPVIGSDKDIPDLISKGYYFLITIGQIKTVKRRQQLFKELTEAKLTAIISPHAYVSHHAQIGQGTIIMHGAIVNGSAIIGNNCIINTRAIIEHDAIVEDHCHISTNAVVNGDSHIHQQCFIGSQAMIREGLNIGEKTIIGAGATILQDVAPKSLVRI